MAITARYETLVYPSNRNREYGITVIVYAENRKQAAERAIQIGWTGDARQACVTIVRVEQIPDSEASE